MVDSPHTKDALRDLLRQRRRTLDASQQDAAATALMRCATQVPNWADAHCIAVYMAQDGEIDTAPLESAARSQGKQVYLPVIDANNNLAFARWDADSALIENRYGIPEPPAVAPRRSAAELDIVFIPLVGYDTYCNRLGMGAGYYDRALANASHSVLVGLAHACQCVEEIPMDNWDVPLNYIATDSALYRRRGDGERADVLVGKDNPGL